MPGSDIVTGHVDSNGKTAIVDRFAEGFYMPEPDTCQDWELVSGEESNGKTTIEVNLIFVLKIFPVFFFIFFIEIKV